MHQMRSLSTKLNPIQTIYGMTKKMIAQLQSSKVEATKPTWESELLVNPGITIMIGTLLLTASFSWAPGFITFDPGNRNGLISRELTTTKLNT